MEHTMPRQATKHELEMGGTAHMRVEEALQAAEAYAAALINGSLDMIISVDLDRRILQFNRAAEQTFGYHKAEVVGRPVDLLYADPADGVRVHSATLEAGGFTGEITNKRKNGEMFCAYLSASVMRNAQDQTVRFMGISRDIT
jgi:two-component system, sensor histidine kinase and response regulator